ncbi:histidinol phosphate phosphatase H [Phellopilus nigrolimitatus]|nr:histidinol phosphate phosphatase H [Phellopilus nigrolimitatus]
MPVSHHSHSGQFCKHASGTLEEIVLEAIRQGFVVYGLTEHVPRYRLQDRYPEEENTSLHELEAQFDAFVEEAHRLKNHYALCITLLVGAETEFITPDDLSALTSLLERHNGKIQFLIGSVHHVNGIPIDFDQPTFERARESLKIGAYMAKGKTATEALLDRYLDAQYELLTLLRPEIIGHLDLCRLYNPELDFRDFPEVQEKLKRNISYACRYGALFEFNAAAFRKGWSTAYPGKDVVELVLNFGGRFTISDDSHGPHAVGLNYNKLHRYLRDIGIEELWYLSKDTQTELGREKRCLKPVKLIGDWWSHGFWENRDVS